MQLKPRSRNVANRLGVQKPKRVGERTHEKAPAANRSFQMPNKPLQTTPSTYPGKNDLWLYSENRVANTHNLILPHLNQCSQSRRSARAYAPLRRLLMRCAPD